jgi:hypothetical protein
MPSRIGSMLRRTSSMKRATLGGLKDTLRAHRHAIDEDLTYGSNEYIHKQFFEDDNFSSIIKCLDGGFEVAKDIIDYIEDYHNLRQDIAHRHSSYSNKWKSKLKQQSSLSSYHTTKRAQLQTIRSPENLAQLLQARCDAIQQVITAYRRQVERMYPSERLGTAHKHYRTDTMKKLFKTARLSVSKTSEKLDKLREQEKRAKAALHDADVQCENLSFDSTASKSKVTHANETQEKRQDELQQIQDKISRLEEEYNQEQETYHEKATDIYQQCRELEKERLDQIRQTLIDFVQAAHTSEHSDEYNAVFENLLANIKTQQDSVEDLDFWAHTYHVITESQTTKTSNTNETDNRITTAVNTQQSVVENEEEPSTTDTTTTPAKTKGKKNKKNTTADPTTPNAS